MKQYSKMKNIDVKWIDKIPNSWSTSKIIHIISKPISYGVLVPEWDDDGVPMIRSGELATIEGITKNLGKISRELEEKFKKTRLEGGEILLTVVGSLGQTNVVPKEFSGYNVSRAVAVIKLLPHHDPKYFMYVLKANYLQNYVQINSIKTAQPLLNIKNVNKFPVPIPPSSEQKQISEFLDNEISKLDLEIQNLKKLNKLLNEKDQTLLYEAVTKGIVPNIPMKDSGIEWIGEIPEHWKLTKLKYHVSKIGSGITPKGGGKIYVDKGIPFIRSQNVHFDGLHLNNVVNVTKEIHKKMNSTHLHEYDVLLNITGASIGRCTFIPKDFGEGNVNQHVCILRTKKKLFYKYLSYFISTTKIQDLIQSLQVGASREGLTSQDIKNFDIILPSINEQQTISEYIQRNKSKLKNLINLTNTQIESVYAYRQSLISSVVTGKIDVRQEVVA